MSLGLKYEFGATTRATTITRALFVPQQFTIFINKID